MNLKWARGGLRHLVMLGAAAIMAGGIGAASAADMVSLKMRLNYVPSGPHAPFFLAIKNGWYKEAGLDVEILDGRGSAQTISLVGGGQEDLGFVDLSAASIAMSKGVPVKAIGAMVRVSAYGILVHKMANLNTPADFIGKEVVYNNASAMEVALFKGFLGTAGIDPAKVTLVGVDSSAKEASMINEVGDAAIAPLPYLNALFAGKREFKHIKFSDFGLRLLDTGIVANTTAIKDKAAALKTFMQVSSRAIAYTYDGHMEEAVDAMISMRPDAKVNRQQQINYLIYNIPQIPSPSTEGKPYLYMSETNWVEMVDNLKKVGLLPAEVETTSLYDMSFRPE